VRLPSPFVCRLEGLKKHKVVADNDEDEDTIESVWTKELAWTERMLEKDVRNNSAWHHRFFVVFERPGARVGEGEIRRELRYVSGPPVPVTTNSACSSFRS
jgi:protein farnesyltransferase/geranylgeranyltransferase type-1 subunit alpha